MKNRKFLLSSALLLLLFNSSCESFLEEKPIDQITVDFIYSSVEGLEVGVNALYNLQRSNNFPEYEGANLQANVFFYCADDLGLVRTWHRPYGSTHTASSFPSRKWVFPYQIIDRCNAIITSAKKVEGDREKINLVEAQARAIRGELYLDLIQMYDNILIDTVATTPSNAFDPVEYVPADPKDVYKLIDEDLDFAIEHLDWKMGIGRYNKATVHHIRGKSALWQEKWAEAAEHFDAIIQDGTHYLLSDISKVFGQDANHAEALFVYQRDELLGGNDNVAGGGGTWIGSVFNNRLYEISTGEIIATVENGGQALGWSFPNDYLKSLYEQDKDKRFTTYFYPLELFVNNPAKPNFGEPLPASSYPDNYRQYHWSLKKFHDTEKGLATNDSYKDLIYYRFAETLLLGAEAHWHLDNENPTNATALEYVNMIRARAGVAPYTEFTLDNYLDESARELCFEKNRWFLLKRLGVLVERQRLHYRYGGSSTTEVAEPMADYMVRMPIPQSQIDLMGTFPQNPGY